MARPTRKIPMNVEDDVMTATVEAAKQPVHDIQKMPLNSLGDYLRYNAEARKLNKKLGICRYKIKQCPVELHPHERIELSRKDQPLNELLVYLSNDMIEFNRKLQPGQTYDLPRCIVDHLSSKGTPIWKWFDKPDGSKETRAVSMEPRFSLRTIHKD